MTSPFQSYLAGRMSYTDMLIKTGPVHPAVHYLGSLGSPYVKWWRVTEPMKCPKVAQDATAATGYHCVRMIVKRTP